MCAAILAWRRMRESNPRALSRLAVFETAPFGLLGNSPLMCVKKYTTNYVMIVRKQGEKT